MRITLTIDQGNSYAKATLFRDSEIAARMRCASLAFADILGMLGDTLPDAAIYCAVGRFDEDLVEALRSLRGCRLTVLSHSTPLPIDVEYASKSTLGLDRIAAAVGAASLFPGVERLVADSGTALTLDHVDRSGTFRGGNISPGVKLRLRSLHEYTDRLPEVAKAGELPLFGFDTETAIRAGAIRGVAAEIASAFRHVDRGGEAALVLTGGDAGLLLPLLEPDVCPGRIHHAPDLVAFGLKTIIDYLTENENK
ncbi:MAG: type III pantothenate kinase [Muribaculaceae bacterium]|nr:type III pantothenate kinase [Muribaculaceae bacterium]